MLKTYESKHHLNDHKVLFVFEDEPEVNRIVVGQPWSFDKHLVCI